MRPLLTDPPLQLCLLPEVVQTVVRLLAEAGSCLDSSFAGAEAEAIGSELLRRPRGRATQARQRADVCLSLHLFRAHTTKYKLLQKNTMVRHFRKSTREQGPTNRSTYQRFDVWTPAFLALTREIRHGASRPDPHETRVSRVNRNAAGRVGSGQELFKISRVGSGRVNMFLTLVDRVGSGQQRFKSRASGRVRSRGFQNIGGQVGSGPDISKLSRVGSGQVTRPDPTRPVRFDLTSEKPWYFVCTYSYMG